MTLNGETEQPETQDADGEVAVFDAPQDVTTTGLDLKNDAPDDVTTYQAGEGTITYDPAAKTVTLHNAEIELSAEAAGLYGKAALILPDGDVTLVVSDGTVSSITNVAKTSDDASAVEAQGANLTVTGGGTLKLTAYAYGIDTYYEGSLTVENTALELNTGDQGVYSEYDVRILNSRVTATGRGDNSDYASALDSTDGNIVLTNSTVNVQDNYYYAVSADNCGALLMENSKLTVRNTTGAINVYPDGNEDDTLKNSIKNSNIDIQYNSGAPFVDEGATEIENSTVIMKTGGKNAFDHWYGGITVGGSSYVELEATESALYIARTTDELTLNDGLTVLEGEVTVHDGVKPKVTSTPRLVIGPMVKIDFDTAGGTEIDSVSQGYGNKLATPKVPEKYGHTFTGWYTDADCTELWNFETGTITADMTLYAGWKANRYALIFDVDGGTDTEDGTFTFGEALGTLPTPKKDGYTFDGWFDANGNAVTENTAFETAQDVILYARWTKTVEPTVTPTPTEAPTAAPAPTAEPTATPAPTTEPTATAAPTAEPTAAPAPTAEPTAVPTATPNATATAVPTTAPSNNNSNTPKTGSDYTAVIFSVSLLVVSGAAIALLVLRDKKRGKHAAK